MKDERSHMLDGDFISIEEEKRKESRLVLKNICICKVKKKQ
jgi:hypothetical protein